MNPHAPTAGQQLLVTLNFFDSSKIAELMMPENNFIGVQILGLLLNSKLEAAGQLLQPASFCGQLNHGCGLYSVSDAHESARIVRETLQQANLALAAYIYRFDEDEMIYRSLFPAPGRDMQIEDCQRLLNAIAAISAPAIARMNEFASLHQSKAETLPEALESPDNPS